ncbi:cytoplasmic dynein 1 light intermediate chain 1-like [Clytia hemisphaerica]|uniref:Dynein light intermediate chain n=1 Tax=Clytia hemisphaerica TaxID=252671 RepID=A0A7M5V6J4_9CNID|eukprot:TCONS_00002059-protein
MADRLRDELNDSKEEEEENFWKQILREVSAKSSRRFPSCKRILVLGNDGTGKTSLVMKLRRSGDDLLRGSGLEYTYLDVDDEERDEHTRLSVWIQSGEAHIKDLMKYVITKESIHHSLILLCIDISKPWNMLDQLENHVNILRQHLHTLNISAKILNELEKQVLRDFHMYKYNDEENKRLSSNMEQDEQEMNQLAENMIVDNIGLPIVVAVTKTDNMSSLEQEHDYREEHFDFIQKNLRKFCLKCGASLIYTSTKENCNTSVLYKYLLHRLYNFPLKDPAQIVEKDAIYIPAGWDNQSKINILDEHIKTFDANETFKDRIVKPVTRKYVNQEKEVVAEDEQKFLEAQMAILSKEPAPSSSAQRGPPSQDARASARMQGHSPGQRATGLPRPAAMPNMKGKPDPTKGGAAGQNSSETVLANFFNSLLNKNSTGKPGGPPGKGAPPASGAANRSDVQAELEKMSRKTIKKEEK